MSRAGQLETQPDMFGQAEAPVYRPDPAKVRARLALIIGEVRSAKALPWQPAELSLYRVVVPQLTNWLPDEEAKQLRFEFEQELERLMAA